MPFGLKNALAMFQRLMDQVLSELQENDMFVYLDDIVIYASSLVKYQTKLNKFVERLQQEDLKLQSDKCEFLRKERNYLKYVIGKDGVKPDPLKVLVIKEFPRPRN